jgi:hypothetical protein
VRSSNSHWRDKQDNFCFFLNRFLGSIKLAVPLLSLIVGILIWATFYESQVGSAVVSRMIYKSSWFGALMFLLALNLSVSALGRYPWRGARKIGFALTHFGLIVLIAGSGGNSSGRRRNATVAN